jgi:trehalose synthase-fused probable maltokinase
VAALAFDGAPQWGGVAEPPWDAVAAYLSTRRWSGARSGAIRFEGRAVFRLLEAPLVDLHVLRVRVGAGAPYELALPLAYRPLGDPALPPASEWVAAHDQGAVYDATLDADARLALLDGVRAGGTFGSGGVVAGPLAGAVIPPSGASRVSSAEQSNTSILYRDAGVMLKLFRRVEVGENPDVEIGRFLAGRAFPHVPRLYGTIALRRDDGDAVLAMAQALVDGAEDAWAYATRAAAAAVQAGGPEGAYAAEAARLGAVTRALHDALASDPADPDFAPEPAGAAHVARWAANTRRAVAEAAESARAAGGAAAALLGARRAAVDALVDAAVAAVGDGAGAAVRHHGDYHLGQVLRGAGGDLFVIDFEGEPAKPLAERRLKHSPLRDVAGMLRSFGYAAGFALRSGAAGGGAAARAAAWEAAARAAFVDAYFAGPRAAYLPPTPGAARALLALFELEKLVYEVRYELLNRPDWADIPLGALRARLTPNPTGA